MADGELFTAADWSRHLTRELRRPVVVQFGRARRQVIVARAEGEELRVRMNAGFGRAPEEVREAVAKWMRVGKRARAACERLDAWIGELAEGFRDTPARRVSIRMQGEFHDLERLSCEVIATEFPHAFGGDEPRPQFTWGRRGSRPRRSMQLGSFDPDKRLIRVHPVLDQASVPASFVRYVLFHELLHAVMPEERCTVKDNVLHHGPRFLERERAYFGYRDAMRWQAAHVTALMQSARTGKPMRVERRNRAEEPSPMSFAQGLLFPS